MVPCIQTGKVDWTGGVADWMGPPRREPLVFVVSGRNVRPGRFRRCIESMARQKGARWGAVVFDDSSDPMFAEHFEIACEGLRERCTVVRNRRRRGLLTNLVTAIRTVCADPESVIVTLDADDALIGDRVLERLAAEYARYMKRLPRIRAGRSLVVFYFRKDMEAVTAGIEDRKTDTGTMKMSSAALTALDLLRYPQASGGVDNVATVLSDLGQKIDPEQLSILSALVERPVVQRLGYLLEHLGHDALTEPMLEALRARGSLPWTELDRQEARDPDFAPEPRQRDLRWRVIVRRVPQRDA